MAALKTSSLTLPANFAEGIVKKMESGSAVAQLSQAKPMLFGDTNIVTFNTTPRAEFVEEGGKKSSMDAAFGLVKATPRKAQVTVRFTNELDWADADHKLGIINELTTSAANALTRALDLGIFYRLNPATGQTVSTWDNYLTSTTKVVTATGDADKDLEQAIGLVLTDGEGFDVNGMALSNKYAFDLATTRDKQGRTLYPELGFGTGMKTFKGIPTCITSTVEAPEATTKPDTQAIVGDFQNGIYWGIQRNLPVERIDYGDPDGLGDLKRENQFALRMEILYAWYVFADRFAVVNKAKA